MSRNTYNLTHNATFMKLKEEQLTKKWIGRIFQVFPDSVVLISEDGEVETPDPSTGRFKLHRYADYNVIANSLSTCTMSQPVGSPSTGDDSAVPYQKPASLPSKGLSKKMKLGNPHKPPGVTAANQSEEWTKNIEIHRFHPQMAEFKKVINFPVLMSPESSTISDVAAILSKEAFEGRPVIILDNDNLVVPDTVASRGHKFWKGNKKIKAVSEEDFALYNDRNPSSIQGSSKTVKHFPLILSSSDDDFELPPVTLSKAPPKKKMRENSQIEDVLEKLQSIERSIEKLKESKDNPPSAVGSAHQLREMLLSRFKCIICTMILHENSLILPCCNQIGCCESCLKQWLEESATCPHCRCPISISSCIKMPAALCDIITLLRQSSEIPTTVLLD